MYVLNFSYIIFLMPTKCYICFTKREIEGIHSRLWDLELTMYKWQDWNSFLFFPFFFFFFFFRAAPSAYGGSQARGRIGAVAAGLCHTATATPDLSHICDLHHSSWQRQILNPLRKARDQTRNLMVPSRIR